MVKKDQKENLNEKETKSQSTQDEINKAKGHSKSAHSKEEKHKLELTKKLSESEAKVAELQDKYLRLSAEFDNYRKRTLKEKADLLKTAGEESLTRILPVLDDMERAINSMESAQDINPVKEGIRLIYGKFKDILAQQGIKEIEAYQQGFNTDLHEAVTTVPAQDQESKGKVLEVIQKGYFLNDKVIRFAKVIIGE